MNSLTLLNSDFLAKLNALLDLYRQLGIDYVITSTYRTKEEQRKLKEKGFPTADDSPHFYRVAVDIEIMDSQKRALAKKIALENKFRAFDYPGHPISGNIIHVDDMKGTAFNLPVNYFKYKTLTGFFQNPNKMASLGIVLVIGSYFVYKYIKYRRRGL